MLWQRLVRRCGPLLGLLLLVGALASSRALAAPTEPDCSNPQEATDSMFRWLQPDAYDPARAARCLALPEGAQGERLAVQLKQVLDARGIWVPVAGMPTMMSLPPPAR